MTCIFGKLFTLSKRIYVIAFAKVSSSTIFQGGGVSKIFGTILHFQLIINLYWPTHLEKELESHRLATTDITNVTDECSAHM